MSTSRSFYLFGFLLTGRCLVSTPEAGYRTLLLPKVVLSTNACDTANNGGNWPERLSVLHEDSPSVTGRL